MLRIGFLAFVCLYAVSSTALEYREIWRVDGKGGFSAPNVITLPNNTNAIIASERDVGVIAFDVNGNPLWTYALTPPATAAPAVADIDGDGQAEIVAADGVGTVVALRHNGNLVWETKTAAGVNAESCPAVVDLDDDGNVEILIGDTGGTLSCFDHKGAVRWSFTGDGGQMGPVLAADIYDLPGVEIVVTSLDRHIYALDCNGNWLWDLHRPDDLFPNSTPVLADVNGDDIPELYVGGGLHHFYQIRLDKPAVEDEKNVYLHVNSAIGATDLDGDGFDEVIFGNKGGAIYCYGKEGMRWSVERPQSNQYAAPLFLNLDEDDDLEILLYSQRNDLAILDRDGAVLAEFATKCGPSAAPLAGDFDGDGMLDLVATTAGEFRGSGPLVFASLGVPYEENPRNRLSFAVNAEHSGRGADLDHPRLILPEFQTRSANASVEPVGETRLFSWNNNWRFDISNSDSARLVFLTSITSPGGTVRHHARHIAGAVERATLPVHADAAGQYEIAHSLIDADERAVLSKSITTMDFNGIETDLHYALNELIPATRTAIHQWRNTNQRAPSAMESQVELLHSGLSTLDASMYDPRRMAETVGNLERFRQLAETGIALVPENSFAAWEFNPWAYFHPRDTLPTPMDRTEQINVALCREEYESRAINVTNFTNETLNILVRTRATEETVDPTAILSFRRAVLVPTVRREQIADALPELDSAGILTIPGFETAQLWLTFNATGLEAGEYAFELVLRSVEPDPNEVVLPIRVTVHPLSMPRPRPLRFCLWAYDGGDLGTDRPEVLQDLIDHGVTIFFGATPSAECDETGNLTAPIDFSAHDESVQRLSPHGMLLFLSPQARIKGAPFQSDAWKNAFVAYLREWVSHLKTQGLDYDDWALYPYDEPSTPFTDTTINLVEVAKVVREADPNILIYTDPTSGTTMETVEMFTGLIDIWCPSAELLDRLGDELVPVAKQVGKEVWFYDAAGRAKTLSSLTLYRWRFWYAWNMGFTGAGWWTYAHHGPSRWDGPNETSDFFATVYEGSKGPVASKRWEAAREGVEDYEYLFLLRDSIELARARGMTEAELEAANHLLQSIPREMAAMLRQPGQRIPLTPDGVPAYTQMTERLDEARAAIIAMCIELNGA
jgi:hypothetical protein